MQKMPLVRLTLSLVAAFSFFGLTQVQAASWPASSTATILFSSSTTEPSGVMYHPRLDRIFFVGDEGQVFKMKTDGTIETTWNPGGDLEGITVVDPSSNYVYLALEKPNDSILQFDITTGQLTGKTWDVSTYLISGVDANHQDANLGMEGLTWVPNGKHPYSNSNSGGVFYTALQYDGKVYVFDVNLTAGGQFTYLGSLTPVAGRTYISDLYYSSNTNTVYALFGSALHEMRPDGTTIVDYTSLPGTRQEGFALIESDSCTATTATAIIAEDTGAATPGTVKLYASYPVTNTAGQYTYYLDADGDGLGSDTTTTSCSASIPSGYVSNSDDLNDSDYDNDGISTSADCNDADSTISALQTYYLDFDGDGLGSDTTISICSYTPTTGYVTNSSDLNDTDYDNDGVSTSADCDDRNSSVTSGYTYYVDADGDGLGAGSAVLSCSATTPTGYVTNNLDLNDSDYDNDGVSTTSDCDDHNASIFTAYTFYQDLDSDGMGSSVTTTACSATPPTGYVTNSNESRDANDLIPNAGIEIADDLRDNDGDGEIDEYNYLATNGLHPYYSTFDPANYSLAVSSMISLGGATNGNIKVRFADNSVYRYKIFSTTTSRLTKVRFYNNTGYLLVTAPTGKKVLVNGYTGAIVRTISTKK